MAADYTAAVAPSVGLAAKLRASVVQWDHRQALHSSHRHQVALATTKMTTFVCAGTRSLLASEGLPAPGADCTQTTGPLSNFSALDSAAAVAILLVVVAEVARSLLSGQPGLLHEAPAVAAVVVVAVDRLSRRVRRRQMAPLVVVVHPFCTERCAQSRRLKLYC